MVIGTALGPAQRGRRWCSSVALAFLFGLRPDDAPASCAPASGSAPLWGSRWLADTVPRSRSWRSSTTPSCSRFRAPWTRGSGALLFLGSLAFSLVVAFLLTTPVNRWMISRGRGHAVVHAYHHH